MNDDLRARLVALGFEDPDLEHLDKSAPTCSRRARNAFMGLAAAKGWRVRKGDVRAAFSQSDDD